jgi:uncharacterized protein (DUF2236 family)
MRKVRIQVRVDPAREASAEGLFPRDSVLRRTVSETVGLMGGGRSLLMQIAHPKIAAGVADHSSFQGNPLGRLERTIDVTLGIILGDREHALEVLRRFHALHSSIQGRLSHDAGPYAAGESYHAHDPALKLWVHATLIDGTLQVYERFVRPLSPPERRGYYEDSMALARYFGIPETMIPPTLERFGAYMRETVEGDTLAVTEITRSLARDVLYPDVWAVPRAAGPLARFVTAGLLPPRLRDAYGFRWDERRQAALDSISRAIRLGLPLVPAWLRLMPHAGGGPMLRWVIGGGKDRRGEKEGG